MSYDTQNGGRALSAHYLSLSGTSMATAAASGAVADLLEAEPDLTPDQGKVKLMKTAYKTFPATSTAADPTTGQTYLDQYDAFTVGAGDLDLQAALADTSLPVGAAMSPVATWDPVSGNAYFTPDPSAVWDSTPDYSLQYVWGNTVLPGSNALWDSQDEPWGVPLSASQSVWGNRSVWGNQSVWESQSVGGNGSTQATQILTIGER
jgi:serine protease AprX